MPWGMSSPAVIVDTILTLSTIQKKIQTFFAGKGCNRSLVQMTKWCNKYMQVYGSPLSLSPTTDIFLLFTQYFRSSVCLWTEVNKIIAYRRLKLCAQCIPSLSYWWHNFEMFKIHSTWEQHFNKTLNVLSLGKLVSFVFSRDHTLIM